VTIAPPPLEEHQAPPESTSGEPAEPPPNEPRRGRDRARRSLVIVLLVVTVVVLLVLAFEGPVANAWHDVRQRHLASDLLIGRRRAAPGQALGTIQIPAIDVNQVVVEGDTPEQLRGGPGHRIGTPLPGAKGNSLIFAHAAGWGGPFGRLDELHKKDLVVVKTRLGSPIVYSVLSIRRVHDSDVRLLAPSTDHRVTLVTGAGGTLSDQLVVVSAVSGDPAKLRRPPSGLTPYNNGPVPTSTLLLMVVAFTVARAAFLWFKRRGTGMVGTLVVVVPLALAGLLAALVLADQYLASPLH
jgi:LPXTG-site transpeptidase (sortase) family protein